MKAILSRAFVVGWLIVWTSLLPLSSQSVQAGVPPNDVEAISALLQSGDSNSNNDFRILTYNVYMLARGISDWSPDTRATNLLASDIFYGQDVVILEELFDNVASMTILNGLKSRYPHQTPVLGRSRSGWDETRGSYSSIVVEDGGVSIISRWPIVEKIQHVYASACGWDGAANKGFVYVKVNKSGRHFHIIGTHTQADDRMCSDAAGVRATQLQEIQSFIAGKNIDREEVVFIGGDLNVDRGNSEYHRMLDILEVNEPHYSGYTATWDPKSNGIAHYNYPESQGQYLDYIFVSRNHGQPDVWQNQAIDLAGPRWEDNYYQFQELSDHYPVAAFAYANVGTRTQSVRAVNQPYSQVALRNQGNGKFVRIDPYNSTGWLMVDNPGVNNHTNFNISNWHPGSAFCLRSGDYVEIESGFRKNYFWNWWFGGGAGNFGYYTKYNDASNKLRMLNLNDHGGCLKSGDKVVFIDRDTSTGREYFLTRWASGSWTNYLFMWSSTVGANESFAVQGVKPFQYQQWSGRLIYR